MSSASQEKATATETTTQEGGALDQMLSVVDALKPKSDSARKEIESEKLTQRRGKKRQEDAARLAKHDYCMSYNGSL